MRPSHHRLLSLTLGLAALVACNGKDGDGVHTGLVHTGEDGPASRVDRDGDGWSPADGDCDDSDPAVSPDAEERCDGRDEDCDGEVDDDAVDATPWYTDADGDGWGDPAGRTLACAPPPGAIGRADDCDDTDDSVHPGAEEPCFDLVDRNCDGSVAFTDADGDGWAACQECDDSDAEVNPDIPEVCDGVDQDCNGLIDDGVLLVWFRDTDGDGWGDPVTWVQACEQPSGYVADDSDCDDLDATLNPDTPWYVDADADGFGDVNTPIYSCEQPSGTVADDSDCDDTDALVNPGADELCNGIDDDCDAVTDEPDAVDAPTWYADADADGFGDASVSQPACAQPSGHVADDTDCDDAVSAVNPAASERCNGIDDDCDAVTDEPDAVDAPTWYADADADTYGDPNVSRSSCTQPSGYVADNTDCDDTGSAINPAATERPGDEVDQDCDNTEVCYLDNDNDGFRPNASATIASSDLDCRDVREARSSTPTGDCRDDLAAVNPAAAEVPGDEFDQNCDGIELCYIDGDDDNYRPSNNPNGTVVSSDLDCRDTGEALASDAITDCDDSRRGVNPGATEGVADGRDQNCDGLEVCYVDSDNDGYGSTSTTTSSNFACTASYVSPVRSDCNDGRYWEAPGMTMYRVVSVYHSGRQDHMTTVMYPATNTASADYANAINLGYRNADPFVLGWTIRTPPTWPAHGRNRTSDFNADFAEVGRSWSSAKADHITHARGANISDINADHRHGSNPGYVLDSISLGWLPRNDFGSLTWHWDRGWKGSYQNHRMAAYPSHITDLASSGFAADGAAYWIFDADHSCP